MINIQLNGKAHTLDGALTVTQLLETLGHANQRVAVERNGSIVPRSTHTEVMIADGDQIEIVVAVGGG